FNPGPGAPRDLAGRLAGFLNGNTDIRWMVSVSHTMSLERSAESRPAAATRRARRPRGPRRSPPRRRVTAV
ncbi:MAG TPA: hypothetical protein ENK19_01215, partial [Acidobacteria bacterium]|nr:hypothetical protein [Acidobacteriota bacterium]